MKRIVLLLMAFSLLLSACAQEAVHPESSEGGNVVNVDIKDFKFTPADITIHEGDTVVWTNDDAVSHTVVSDDGTVRSKELLPGDKFQFTFNKHGTHPYKCGIHPSMTGSVKVE